MTTTVSCIPHPLSSKNKIGRIREFRMRGQGEDEMPNVVTMLDGRAFWLQRPLVNSIFGAVIHSVEGNCRDPNK